MPLSKSLGRLGLAHSDPEILKEVQFTVMNPKDPFMVSTLGDFRMREFL